MKNTDPNTLFALIMFCATLGGFLYSTPAWMFGFLFTFLAVLLAYV